MDGLPRPQHKLALVVIVALAVFISASSCFGVRGEDDTRFGFAPSLGGQKQHLRRVLFLTLEYADPIFSGNGVLSRAMVSSLATLGYEVLVVCATPQATSSSLNMSYSRSGDVHILSVPVPAVKWLRLDQDSAWQEFGTGVASLADKITAFNASIRMAVDWSAWVGMEQLHTTQQNQRTFYLTFRVFSQSAELLKTAADRLFYTGRECTAVRQSSSVVALSHYDVQRLQGLGCCRQADSASSSSLSPSLLTSDSSSPSCSTMSLEETSTRTHNCHDKPFATLHPPVRGDILLIGKRHWRQHIAQTGRRSGWAQGRRFITCCVRLSREKNAMLFADLAVELSAFLQHHHVSLRLCGAAADKDYAAAVKERLSSSGVAVEIWDAFSSAARLMEAFETSLLNIHPSLHDAFGMTVVEAATVVTPSLIHNSRAVGVGETFSDGEVFRVNLTAPLPHLAAIIRTILSNRAGLARVGKRAQGRSLSFDHTSYRRKLQSLLQQNPV